MENKREIGTVEIAGLVVIILAMLYLPYLMVVEHVADNTANSYYHDGR